MGCATSHLLNHDEDFTKIGTSALTHHIVSLTSTTYGLLTLDPSSSMPKTTVSIFPPPRPEPTSERAETPPEVINSWELMAGLDSTTESFRLYPLPSKLSQETSILDLKNKNPVFIQNSVLDHTNSVFQETPNLKNPVFIQNSVLDHTNNSVFQETPNLKNPVFSQNSVLDHTNSVFQETPNLDQKIPASQETPNLDIQSPVFDQISDLEHKFPIVKQISDVDHTNPVQESPNHDHRHLIFKQISDVDHKNSVFQETPNLDLQSPVFDQISDLEHKFPIVKQISDVDHKSPFFQECPNLDKKSPVFLKSLIPRRVSVHGYENLCPPNGENKVVLYTTSLRGVRATFEACTTVRTVLEAYGVAICERDISMDSGFREELRELMKGKDRSELVPPRVFVKGRYVGGVDAVVRAMEDGSLGQLVDGLPKVRSGYGCEGCGGVRFLPCFGCSGSCKVVVDWEGGGGGRRKRVVVRCGECNENGLVRCPVCG